MSKYCINIDELINGVSKINFSALMHAAEISPFVTERTLGPDLPEYQSNDKDDPETQGVQEESESKATPKRSAAAVKSEPKKTKKTNPLSSHKTKTVVDGSPLSSYQPMDFQSINNSILLREAEQNRRKSIRQEVLNMQEKFANTKKHADSEKQRQLVEENAQWLAEKRRSDSFIIAESEKQAAKQQQENEQELNALHQQTQRQLQIISFQGISQYHNKFRGKYENVARLLLSIDKQELLACEDYNRRLKELIPQFEQLITKIKAGECGATELRDAENLCKSLDALEDSIIKALENIVQQAEERTLAAKNQEDERKQQELQQQQQQQLQQKQEAAAAAAAASAVAQAAATASNLTKPQEPPQQPQQPVAFATAADTHDAPTAAGAAAQYVSAERFAFYTQINSFYQDKVERVKPLQTDENMKKYRFACQKAINIPVNAISAVSSQHLKDKFEKLYNFISGQPLKTLEGQMVSVNDHPLGRDYCILLMAKKFVSQGDTAISSNPQAAFPVATIIVSLWKLVPDFGQIFLAYIFKESPFLVPYFIPQKRDQAVEDYYKVLGYRITNGQLEQQDMYLKRQAGIARLYAAVMITGGRQADGPQHPYAIEQAWRWLSNFCTLAPLPDICATLIMEMLQIVGADMWSAYGKQFVKLLFFVQQHYFPKLSAVDEGGPKARLELMLGKFLREGQIARAQGVLPAGFW